MQVKNSMKTCGAKNRRGTPCQRAPMRNGRCLNHGGKSPKSIGHPNYKHGRYSKYSGIAEKERAKRLAQRHLEKRLKATDKAIGKFIKTKGREPDWNEIFAIFLRTNV